MRGCGSIARGRTRSSATRGTLKEIKEAVTKNKDETLSSNKETLDEDEEKEDKTEEGEKKDKENEPQSRKNQTTRRGRPFAHGGRVREKIQVTDCSINLDKDCIDKAQGGLDKKENKRKKKTETEVEKKEETIDNKNDEEKSAKSDDKMGVQNEGSDALKDELEQTSEKHEENQDNVNEEGCKKREDEEINTGDVGDSYEVSMMIGYINNSEIADGEEKVDKSVNMKGTVESNAVLELEEDKQHRMDVIGQSLIISKLKDELDNELKTKFNVKNTEERIRRLKERKTKRSFGLVEDIRN